MTSFFADDPRGTDSRVPFLPPSLWEPPSHLLPPLLLDVLALDKAAYSSSSPAFFPDEDNVTRPEWEALQQLQKNSSIVIKPADKGSAVVVMDRTLYVTEAMRQLSDPQYYAPLQSPIYPRTAVLINGILSEMVSDGFLSEKQLKFLTSADPPRPRQLYLLPKIHKPQTAWPTPLHMPPGRPIVSDCDSESSHVAALLEHYLHPLSTKHPSYLKDTYDFLSKIKDSRVSDRDLLFTMDVESLYTNIDTDRGLLAVKKWLERFPDPARPDDHLLALLRLGLTRNDFLFNGSWFLQIKGTAMGKRFAPSYANIYMADWEETIFSTCPKLPSHYYRYLDDVWGIWPHSREDLQDWIVALNNHHPSIRLKETVSLQSVDFLDVTISKGVDPAHIGKLVTKVYFKPTDTHALLHKASFHPQHTFRGIVKSQLIRFHRLCTRPEDEREATSILFRALRKRNYTRTFLRRAASDSISLNNPERGDPTLVKIPIISTYSAYSTQLHRNLKSNLDGLKSHLPSLDGSKVISAFRRNPNLQDHLVRAKLPTERHPTRPLPQRHWVRNPCTQQSYTLPDSIPNSTANCVYALGCRICHKVYVGETANSVGARLSTHRYSINVERRNTILARHFRKHGTDNMRIKVLAHDSSWSRESRRKEERTWIRRLNSRHPGGLNECPPFAPRT